MTKTIITSELKNSFGFVETSVNDLWYYKKWTGPKKAYKGERVTFLVPRTPAFWCATFSGDFPLRHLR
ncbi:hypothetical protein B5X24_HaOG214805 [Helicoverpa armigera]|nr:hypothetical protein B5X24_HaOG214805 [Helicoverpa armigera]